MGECGCGNFSGDLTFPGPDGDVYVLDVYHGCEDCDAPAGVVLYRFTPEEAERWGVEHAEQLAIPEEGIGVPVMDADVLKRLMVKEVPTNGDWKADHDPADLCRETIADGLRAHFRDASWKTYAEWSKRRTKRDQKRRQP